MQLLIAISLFFSFMHPVHVSFTNIEYVEEAQEIQIASRVFWDDVETSINQQFDVQLNLGTEAQHPEYEEFIRLWFANNLRITIDGKTISPEKLRLKDIDMGAVDMLVNLSFDSEKPRSMQVENLLLCDLFADQSNLVILTMNEKQESFSLTAENNVITLEIE